MFIYLYNYNPNCYYVYAYLREDGTPYYIGKGKGRRWKHKKTERIRTPNDHNRIVILESNLTEVGAFAIERRMIRWFGRKDNDKDGILHNLADGGEGSGGFTPSEQTRRIWSEQRKGKTLWNLGKKLPGNGGRKKGRKWTEQERSAQSVTRSATGYYDYLKCPQRAKKISEAQKGRQGTSTGTVWYNNGIVEKQIASVDEVPIGFTKGRLINNSSKKGLRWYNNGRENRQFREDNVPESFIQGRLSTKQFRIGNTN